LLFPDRKTEISQEEKKSRPSSPANLQQHTFPAAFDGNSELLKGPQTSLLAVFCFAWTPFL
jgi:hypothetical protein